MTPKKGSDMPLATLKEVLGIATQSKTAIPGFNIDNIEIPEAIITAAEEYHCPVILTIGQGAIQAGQMHHLADVVRRLADESTVPVVMHLDHGASYEQTIQCLRAGFTSVMFDGSHLPFEENVRITQEVVKAAHAVGVSVEAELGAIYGVEDGISRSVCTRRGSSQDSSVSRSGSTHSNRLKEESLWKP